MYGKDAVMSKTQTQSAAHFVASELGHGLLTAGLLLFLIALVFESSEQAELGHLGRAAYDLVWFVGCFIFLATTRRRRP